MGSFPFQSGGFRATSGFKVRVAFKMDGLETLWHDLQSRSACYVFQAYEWVDTWFKEIGYACGYTPTIALVSLPSRVVMLMPLATRRSHSMNVVSFAGGFLSDYAAPIIDRDFSAALTPSMFGRIWNDVVAAIPDADLAAFEGVPQYVEDVENPMFKLSPSVREEAHYAELPRSAESYARSLPRDFVKDYRRRMRRLAENGKVAFRETEGADRSLAFEYLIRQKTRRWLETTGKAPPGAEGWWPFYRAMLERQIAGGRCSLFALSVADDIVATLYGISFHGRFVSLVSGFERGQWQPFSPGKLLKLRVIEWCIGNGLSVFDLTTGNEPYKSDWAPRSFPTSDLRVPTSLLGHAYCISSSARQSARSSLRLPRRVVRRMVRRVVPAPSRYRPGPEQSTPQRSSLLGRVLRGR